MTTETRNLDWYDDDEEEPWHPDDPRSYIVPLLEELLDGSGPEGELPPPDVAARQGVEAPYFRKVIRLGELVEPSVDPLDRLVPNAADARRLADALDLVEEEKARRRRRYELDPPATATSTSVEDLLAPLDSLSSDMMWTVLGLRDLWLTAFVIGAIEVDGSRARPGITLPALDAMSVAERLRLARTVAACRISDLIDEECFYSGCLHLLVLSFAGDRAWRSVPESVEFAVRRERGRHADDTERRRANAGVDAALNTMVEAGVVERDGDRARLTEFGVVVIDHWVSQQIERL